MESFVQFLLPEQVKVSSESLLGGAEPCDEVLLRQSLSKPQKFEMCHTSAVEVSGDDCHDVALLPGLSQALCLDEEFAEPEPMQFNEKPFDEVCVASHETHSDSDRLAASKSEDSEERVDFQMLNL